MKSKKKDKEKKLKQIIEEVKKKTGYAFTNLKKIFKETYLIVKKWLKAILGKLKVFIDYLKTYQIYVFVSILCLVCALFIVLIYIKVSSFSILAADDFVHYGMGKLGYYHFNDVNIWEEGKSILNGLKYGIYDCLHLGGRYFAMFLQITLGPKIGVNVLEKSRIVMQLINLLYFVSLFLASVSIGQLVVKSNKVKSFSFSTILYLSFLILYHAFHYNAENFTWFSASVSYVVPLSFFLLSVYIFLKEKINVVEAVLLFIFVICAQGGNISISILNLLLLVMFCFILSVNERYDSVHLAFTFHYIVFGLISILAPGNINRRIASLGKNAKNVNLVEGFDWARNIFFERMDKVFTNELIWVFFLFFGIIIGIYIFKSVKKISQTYIVCSIFLLFIPYLIAFLQSFLGNVSAERTNMTVDMIIVINTLNIIVIAVYAVLLILSHIIKSNYEIVLLAFLIIVVSRGLYNKEKPVSFEKVAIVEIVEDLYNGIYDKYYNDYARIMKTLEENRGKENLVVEKIKNKKPKNLNPYVYMLNSKDAESAFFDIKNIVFK